MAEKYYIEPSTETLMAQLSTKKKSSTNGGFTRPGLFSTYGLQFHSIALVVILLLEAATIFLAYQDGLLLITVIVLVFVDIALALFAHSKESKKVHAKNRLLITDDTFERGIINGKIKGFNIFQNVFYFLIFLVGIYKIYLVFEHLYGWSMPPQPIAIFMTVVYALAIVVHILFTGYVIAGMWQKHLLSRDTKNFIKERGEGANKPNERKHLIKEKSTNIVEAKSVNGHHSIIEDGGLHYISSLGILDDESLSELVSKQMQTTSKALVSKEGLIFQLDMIGE